MANENQGVLVADKENLVIESLVTKYKQYDTFFRKWVAKQSLPVEAVVATVTSAAQGAAIGFSLDVCSAIGFSVPPPGTYFSPHKNISRCPPCLKKYQALILGGPLVQARNFAVMTGVHAGLHCVIRRLRGREDVQTSMAAAFGSGVMLSLVTGMRGSSVISVGVFFSLANGGKFKVEEKFSHQRAEDVLHNNTRNLLSTVGLEF